MANERYNFKYLPLVGKLPGKSMVEQTETAINELASVVYDNVGHVGNLAEEVQTANTNASNALDKATEALETSSRVYIKQIAAVDVNDYYDSELYYINNDGSTNIPVRDRGFLEVKTNDDKTACEQVFIADSTGTPYYRHGVITEQTLGEETTYVVTWSSWYRVATTEYVQAELQDYLPLSGGTVTGDLTVTGTLDGTASGNLPLSGGTLTGVVNGVTPTAGDNSTKIATTEFVNAKARNYLPLSGGTMFGWLSANENEFRIRNSKAEHDGAVSVFGGDVTTTGANLYLYGTSHSSQAGRFVLSATDGANTKSLRGQADGTLTWNNKEIATTAFVNAKAGNYLPLSGGTLTGVVNGVTPTAGDNSTKLATTEFVNAKAGGGTPTGVVQAFAGSTTPQGWLLCDGSAVSRTDYAALYAVIGTTYGAGNGSTTFNLPNLIDKFIQGNSAVGTVKSAGLPNITGEFGLRPVDGGMNVTWKTDNGAVKATTKTDDKSDCVGNGTSFGPRINVNINASRSSAIYGNSKTVQPPALTMRYIIKY